jgi:hypothetical protein
VPAGAPAAPAPAAPRPRAAPAGTRTLRWPIVVVTAALAGANAVALPYFVLPMAERVRSPLHAWFRPSGYVGQTAGLLALAIFVFLWLYPLRKRFRWLAFTGAVGRWLDVHIVAALSLPLLIGLHAGWRFGGLIGLGFDAMMVVVASGVVGRYLYARIPRSRSGIELTLEEVQGQRRALLREIAERTGQPLEVVERALVVDAREAPSGGAGRALVALLENDLARWRLAHDLRRRWRDLGPGRQPLDRAALRAVVRLARREMALAQQSRMLGATHRVFRYWHVAHRPIAITGLVAVLVHVAVVVALGATWLW